MRALTRPWGTLHLRVDGAPDCGTPWVFLNSLGTDLRMWEAVLPFLPRGVALRLDFRGHGLSAVAPAPFGIADLVDDVLAAMDACGLARARIVGCSVGGLVAQRLARTAPERVAALVLSNTAPRIGTPEAWAERVATVEAGGMSAIADAIIARWFGPPMHDRPEAALWRAMLERTPAAGYAALCHAIAAEDLTAEVGAIDRPCLVIAGGADGATPPAQVRALAEAVPGAAFVEIAEAGHLPAVETPEAFARALSSFIIEARHE